MARNGLTVSDKCGVYLRAVPCNELACSPARHTACFIGAAFPRRWRSFSRWRGSNGFRLPFRRLGICGNTSAGRQGAAALIEGEGIAALHLGTLFQASPKVCRGQKICVFCRAVLAHKRFFGQPTAHFRMSRIGAGSPPEGFLFDAIKKKIGREMRCPHDGSRLKQRPDASAGRQGGRNCPRVKTAPKTACRFQKSAAYR